jgi:hypothetical protein
MRLAAWRRDKGLTVLCTTLDSASPQPSDWFSLFRLTERGLGRALYRQSAVFETNGRLEDFRVFGVV